MRRHLKAEGGAVSPGSLQKPHRQGSGSPWSPRRARSPADPCWTLDLQKEKIITVVSSD